MISHQLLDNYFKNKSTEAERLEVEAYLAGADHSLLDEFLMEKWRQAKETPSAGVVPPVITLPVKTRWLSLKWAAAIAGIMVLSSVVYYMRSHSAANTYTNTVAARKWLEMSNSGKGVRSVKMSDGTRIWLNRNSILRYPDDYNTQARDVELIGEAYFEVARQTDKPFRVHTALVTTTVLGTAFNVSAFTRDDTAIRISLLEGKVAVTAGEQQRLLTPGMLVNYEDHQLQGAIKDSSVSNTTAWLKDKIYFNNTTLKEVCRRLSWQYGDKIHVSGDAAAHRISGVFSTSDDLKTIIEAISYIHKLQVTRKPGEYQISKQ